MKINELEVGRKYIMANNIHNDHIYTIDKDGILWCGNCRSGIAYNHTFTTEFTEAVKYVDFNTAFEHMDKGGSAIRDRYEWRIDKQNLVFAIKGSSAGLYYSGILDYEDIKSKKWILKEIK